MSIKKQFCFLLVLVLFTFSSSASLGVENKVDLTVNGLVCDFCAQALEKVFGKRKEVADISVNLNKGKITVFFHEGMTIDDQELSELILNSGYNLINIERGGMNDG